MNVLIRKLLPIALFFLLFLFMATVPARANSADASAGETCEPYRFPGPVLVSDLPGWLAAAGRSPLLHVCVYMPGGGLRESGAVCTGDIVVTFFPDGRVDSRVSAVIPGDLSQCGAPDPESVELLYGCLTGKTPLPDGPFAAADLDGDGSVDTADLLALKKTLAVGD